MSTTLGSTTPFSSEARESRVHETFKVYVSRLTLIDTAEDSSQWASRAKRQWSTSKPLVVHVCSNSVRRGTTPPMKIAFSGREQNWTGAAWPSDIGIEVPLADEPMLMLEVCSAKHPDEVIGVGVLNAQAMLAEGRQFAKFCVHFFQVHTAVDANTVHAMVEVEIHSSALDEPPEDNYIPLEYNYGSVRVSTIDFFYPPFLLQGSGQYIVSNIICAMNMTESSSLAMQLLPLREAANYISPEPAQVITVRPQQRVYLSGTFVLSQRACMRPLELQLTVNGSQQPSAPIIIKAHMGAPQPTTADIPYHYWVNTTRITNRQLLPSQELPLIKTILPVYRFLGSGPIEQTEGMIVAFDKDKGEQVLVSANGVPVSMGRAGAGSEPRGSSSLSRGFGGGGVGGGGSNALGGSSSAAASAFEGIDLSGGNLGDLFSSLSLDTNASFVVRDSNRNSLLPSRGPLLNLSQKTCVCTIVLGTIRGFPVVYESATGVSPSFQVSITLLDQKGWQIVKGETLPSYQSASGSLRWSEQLVLRKWPGAESTQFLRLNLTEVRARDGDETPIGAGLISLSSMTHIFIANPMSIAFYVYETYSLYDQLNSASLLMKDVSVVFSDVR